MAKIFRPDLARTYFTLVETSLQQPSLYKILQQPAILSQVGVQVYFRLDLVFLVNPLADIVAEDCCME